MAERMGVDWLFYLDENFTMNYMIFSQKRSTSSKLRKAKRYASWRAGAKSGLNTSTSAPVTNIAQLANAARAQAQADGNQPLMSPSAPRMVTDGTLSMKGIQIDVLERPGLFIVDGVISEEALMMGD